MNTTAILAWAKKNILIVGIVGTVLVALLSWYVIKQGVISDGNKQEANLTSAYSSGAKELSSCVVQVTQMANVASENAKQFQEVVKQAVAGNANGMPVDLNTQAGKNSFLPILVQSWPDAAAGQTALYNKVIDKIASCQTAFSNKQEDILARVAEYKQWLTGSWKVRTFGGDFPSSNLAIAVPGVERVTGADALIKMEQPIVDAVTSQSYQTGQQDAEGPFKTDQ